MEEEKVFKASLTRKEARLIRLLRLQDEEVQEMVVKEINSAYKERINEENGMFSPEISDNRDAYWLNSEYYKK